MADETYAGLNVADIYCGDGIHVQKELGECYDANIKPGFAIRVVSGLIYLTNQSDKAFAGIMALKSGQDIDTAYTQYDLAEYYPKGGGADVWIILEATSPTVAVKVGDALALGTEDGKLRAFVYANATDVTDSSINIAGHALEADTGHVSDDHIIKMRLDI